MKERNSIDSQKGFFLIILGVLVLLAIVAAGAYYVGTRNAKTETQTQESGTRPTINSQSDITSPRLTPTITQVLKDETANWKIYTNNQSGYSLKYPTNWSLKDENAMGRILIESLEGISGSATSNPTVDEESNGFLWVETMDNKSNLLLKSWFDNNETCGTTETGCAPNSPKFSQLTTVNGKEVILADWELPGPLGKGIKVYYFTNGKNIYRFSFFYPTTIKNKNVFSDTYNQILSTFKVN